MLTSKSPTPSLEICLAIYRLAPRGGLEDNCLRIAEELEVRGHKVTFLVAGDAPALPMKVVRLTEGANSGSNHDRVLSFAKQAAKAVADARYDRSVAFQTMPGFDFLFLADKIRNNPQTPWWKRITPRFRTYAKLEAECFSKESPTRLIGLAESQVAPFRLRYNINPAKVYLAPPTLSPQKQNAAGRSRPARLALRKQLGIPADADVWLTLVISPKTKGLDRNIEALARSENSHLLIGGIGQSDKSSQAIRKLAKRLNVEHRVHWLGYLSNESFFSALDASDVLAHPARTEVTGSVILEAMINGLPVVATSHCGFAPYIVAAKAGLTIDEPFDVEIYKTALQQVCRNGQSYSDNGIAFGKSVRLFDGTSKVCDWIEAGF
jgi:UDP-glucose:(heptosyl)LPS alpha-1,3-glucosyltransferase